MDYVVRDISLAEAEQLEACLSYLVADGQAQLVRFLAVAEKAARFLGSNNAVQYEEAEGHKHRGLIVIYAGDTIGRIYRIEEAGRVRWRYVGRDGTRLGSADSGKLKKRIEAALVGSSTAPLDDLI